MPRPKTDLRYAERVAVLAEEGWRPAAIFRVIESEARDSGVVDYPSERTVRRLYEQHRQLPERVRREDAAFRWPAAMESGALPWEASRAALELLRYRDEARLGRPTVRHAKWYWRLTLADPDIRKSEANKHSAWLAAAEFARIAGVPFALRTEAIEWNLAYRPWQSPENGRAYRAAADREKDPIPEHVGGASSSDEAFGIVVGGIHGQEAAAEFLATSEKERE